jgi:FkbM family methyltransferase
MGIRSYILKKIVGKKISKKLIDNIFYFSGISRIEYFSLMNQKDIDFFLFQVNQKRGIGYNMDFPEENEFWFIKNKLLTIVKNDSAVNLFDVGANKGQYLDKLNSCFDKSKIFSFEPNPYSFEILEKRFKGENQIKLFQIGFADIIGKLSFYTKTDEPDTELASLSKEVFFDLHNSKNLEEIKVDIKTIDSFCEINKIYHINFLKIDAEGYEFKILIGAKKMIEDGNISIIQFEFNEMNVISRVFLKDFYILLSDYKFFRIGNKELIALGEYSVENEVFKYQNIIAIRKSIKFENL